MKTRFCFLVIAAVTLICNVWMMVSCNDVQEVGPVAGLSNSSSLRVALPSCVLDLKAPQIDMEAHTVRLEMNASYASGITADKSLEMQGFREGDAIRGFRTTLRDSRDRLLWEFVWRTDLNDKSHFWLTEKTQIDSMTIEQRTTASSFSEVYTINGRSMPFVFPTADQSRLHELHSFLRNNGRETGKMATLSDVDAAVVTTLAEFDRFYDNTNTLHNNPDGDLAVEIMASADIAGWLRDYFGGIFPENPQLVCEECCLIALECAAIKCPEMINPACEVCGAVVVACVIDAIGNELGWW